MELGIKIEMKFMKFNKKDLAVCFLTFSGTLFLLWLFLILSASIPNAKIQDNMIKSALVYAQEDAFSYCDGSKMNGIADNYADSIWLNVAWFMGEGNPIKSSLDTQYYDGDNYGENVGLYLAVSDEQTQPNTDYTRYWHGTAGFIRFLHLFTDVNGIKKIGFVCALFLAGIIVVLLIKDKNALLAAAFVLSLCIVKVWNIRLSMEYQPAFVICFLMCILYLLFEKKGDRYLLFLSSIGGVLIAFFDFLTTETMVILLPLIFVIMVRTKEKRKASFPEAICFITSQFTAWILAYAISFLTKWSLASLLTGDNKFAAALQSVGERINGPMSTGVEMNKFEQILAAPAANISVLLGAQDRIDGMLFILGLFIIASMVIVGVFLYPGKEKDKDTMKILLLLGGTIIVRFMVLSNHSYIHSFFTYRGMVSLIMAVFSIWIINFKKKKV